MHTHQAIDKLDMEKVKEVAPKVVEAAKGLMK